MPNLPPSRLLSHPGYKQFGVSVTNGKGEPQTDLTQSNFEARCGAKPCHIAYFHQDSNEPASIVIVVDASSSMYPMVVAGWSQSLNKSQAALGRAMSKLNPCDELAVITAGGLYSHLAAPRLKKLGLPTAALLLQPFTTDPALVLNRIETDIPYGKRSLADGLRLGLTTLRSAYYPNRAMIVLTDGLDQSQIQKSAKVLESIRKSDIRLWVIGVGNPTSSGIFAAVSGAYPLDTSSISQLATAGGGQALFARRVNHDHGASLARAVSRIVKEVGQGYTMGVVAPAGTHPTLALAKSAATLRAAPVLPYMLAQSAQPRSPRCSTSKHVPAPPPALTSKPGYTQLAVSVTDSKGAPVRGLKASDFTVFSGSSYVPVSYFSPDKGTVPKSVVFVIDTSGSMATKLYTVESELADLIQKLNPCDEIALMAFSNRPVLLQKLTSNHQLVMARLPMLHAWGRTAIYDALNKALKILKGARYHDRAIVLITDGMDNASKLSEHSLIAEIKRNGVPIYAVGIGSGGSSTYSPPVRFGSLILMTGSVNSVDRSAISSIASASGGEAFFVPLTSNNGKDSAAAVKKITDLLNTGYELGFVAKAGTPKVIVKNRRNLTVRVLGAGPQNKGQTSTASAH